MKQLKFIFLGIFLLGLPMSIFSEVSLDEVVQAGRFVFYRDHADHHKYYYIPDAPRLATKPDGTPEFTLIKYTKTDGETKGGILHFLVTWGYTEAELNAAQAMLRIKDPQAKIAGPVPFKEGFFKIVSTTAGEGGLFTRRIVGEGKAPILPGQKAAVSIALTPEGASLLWESFKNPTSDVSVLFSLRFAGLTPAFQAKLKVNWDKVYSHHDVKLHAEGTIKIVKLDADIKAILDDLRQKGAIQLEVAGEDTNMQKLLDSVYAHLISMMCDKVPITAEEVKGRSGENPQEGFLKATPNAPQLVVSEQLEEYYKQENHLFGKGPSATLISYEIFQRGSSSSEQRKNRVEEMKSRAKKLIQEKKFNEAIEIYKNAYKVSADPIILYEIGSVYYDIYKYKDAKTYYLDFLKVGSKDDSIIRELIIAANRIKNCYEARLHFKAGKDLYNLAMRKMNIDGNNLEAINKWQEALKEFLESNKLVYHPYVTFNIAIIYANIGNSIEDMNKKRDNFENSLKYFQESVEKLSSCPRDQEDYEAIKEANDLIELITKKLSELNEGKVLKESEHKLDENILKSKNVVIEGIKEDELTNEQKNLINKILSKQQIESQAKLKESEGQSITGGEKEVKIVEKKEKPKEETKAIPELKKKEQEKPGVEATEKKHVSEPKPVTETSTQIKPIITVQLGYAFKRIKLSGNYEVDLRKRLREDRDIVMSGNISGVFQKYGEDSRFFTIVSLDDPAFQERTIEVILDGQDASDFKNYINSVSVIFRKERFSGPAVTGEVKFFEEQFNRTGNRLTFKYSRLNEAATEWLYYEYKPKWSFYGGIQWEGEWVKTSDSVLTLSPPVRRRTIQITADEENMLKNNIRALALQIKHQIFGTEVIKEVIIDYFKGDPLQAEYTYLHEEGNFAYSYKIIWLLQDGREIQTNWINKESPFIYAIYTGR